MKIKIALALIGMLLSTPVVAQTPAAPALYMKSSINIGDVPVRRGQQYWVQTDRGFILTLFVQEMPGALTKSHPYCKTSLGWVSDLGSHNPVAGCVQSAGDGTGVVILKLFHETGDFKKPFIVEIARKKNIFLFARVARK